MKRCTGTMRWAVVALVGVGLGMCSPAWGAEKEKGEKGSGMRWAYFDPSESGLDAKFIMGWDYWPNERMRVSLEYEPRRYLTDVESIPGYWGVQFLPLTVTWIFPRKGGTYSGYGVGFYTVEVAETDLYLRCTSDWKTGVGFHAVVGTKSGKRKKFIEVKYSVAAVEFGRYGVLKAGGLTLSFGGRL